MNIDDYDLAMDDMPDARVFLIDGPAVRCGVGLLGGRYGWPAAQSRPPSSRSGAFCFQIEAKNESVSKSLAF